MLVGNTEKITFYYQVWTLSQNSRSTFYLYRLAIFLKQVRFLWAWHRIWLLSFEHCWLIIWHWSLDQSSRWVVFNHFYRQAKNTLCSKVFSNHFNQGRKKSSVLNLALDSWSTKSFDGFHITINVSQKIQFTLFKGES